MVTSAAVAKGKIMIYACGGGGINIANMLEKNRGIAEPGFAEINIAYIDTSRSNLKDDIDSKHCYLFDGLDGSGKLRSENHIEISRHVKQILQQFKPVDLNIVISTAAGGSGSVIAPLLTQELLLNGLPTVVVAIGNADTKLDIENTLKTIKSYQAISENTKMPVLMQYEQNSSTSLRNVVDQRVHANVLALSILFSRENQELDSMDSFNWINWNRVNPGLRPQVVGLKVARSQLELGTILTDNTTGNVISVATIARKNQDTGINGTTERQVIPDYQTVGYLRDTVDPSVCTDHAVHFLAVDGTVSKAKQELESLVAQLSHQQAARLTAGSILSSKDVVDSTGIVI